MGVLGDIYGGFKKVGNYIGSLADKPGEKEQIQGLLDQSGQAGDFANRGEAGFGAIGGQLGGEAEYMRRVARGQESVSAEQLRQAAQQNVGAQQSMAASAAPNNSAMAGLMASRNAMQIGSGLAGQQAVAGIQERQAAQQRLADMLLQQRQQELQAALQSRQNAMSGLGQIQPGQSWLDKWAGPIGSAAGLNTGGKK